MKNVKQKRIVYYKMEMVLRNWETTHDLQSGHRYNFHKFITGTKL